MQEEIEIGGKSYPVAGKVKAVVESTGSVVEVPMVELHWMSDYKWQLGCLNDRLKHREQYAEHEDVDAVKAELHDWLESHKDMAPQTAAI